MKNLSEYLDPPTPEAAGDRDGMAVLAMMRRVHRKQQKQIRAAASEGGGAAKKRKG